MWRWIRMNNELYHHGVKGMKWGVRRTPQQLGHKVKKYAYKKRSDNRRLKKAYAQSKSMSDSELKKANKRFVEEQNYRTNVKKDIEAGRSPTERFLRKNGNMFVSAALGASIGGAGAYVGKRILKKAVTKKM